MAWPVAGLLVLVLAGCVVVPVTREVYDPACRLMKKEMTLEAAAVGTIATCHAEECAALLATLGIVGAASAVVSGSIALVGNVVYWFEHQGRCGRQRDAAQGPDAAGRKAPAESGAPAPAPAPAPNPAASPTPARPLPVPGMVPHPNPHPKSPTPTTG